MQYFFGERLYTKLLQEQISVKFDAVDYNNENKNFDVFKVKFQECDVQDGFWLFSDIMIMVE